jgi:hypothetical protein
VLLDGGARPSAEPRGNMYVPPNDAKPEAIALRGSCNR